LKAAINCSAVSKLVIDCGESFVATVTDGLSVAVADGLIAVIANGCFVAVTDGLSVAVADGFNPKIFYPCPHISRSVHQLAMVDLGRLIYRN
jgi:hypothetical protein